MIETRIEAALMPLYLRLRTLGPWDLAATALILGVGVFLAQSFSPAFALTCCLLPLVRVFPTALGPVAALLSGLGYSWWQNQGQGGLFSEAGIWCLIAGVAAWHVGRRGVAGWILPLLAVAALIGTTPWQLSATPAGVIAFAYVAGRIHAFHDRVGLLNQELHEARDEVTVVRSENRSLEERSALARELHDVVGHHLSVISLAAEGANLNPDTTSESLQRIRIASTAAMSDLDVLLRSLRADGESAPLEPYKGLANIEELTGVLREAGIQVESRILVTIPVPEGLQLTAYRIVQEGVTNIVRHSQAGRAALSITTAGNDLLISIGDDGVGFSGGPDEQGRGLVGIGERVASFGGIWSTGTSEAGGSVLDVRLPIALEQITS
ncbi:hypothetical protein Kisp01_28140 [Kineosporia sp. NBRC 101677]|uniref:sensor histidine kinase n=1 Tax=Kineosporia sp. NBRC 101677 TaxID=3032197 RepID=UPI0024A489C3|nr:histidine kinase [Kineosporia sp. NBRC 101677]GLY15799.1 hypothetical protein Kisp01_28140 [Kineosporia sp. NBRC 101677]